MIKVMNYCVTTCKIWSCMVEETVTDESIFAVFHNIVNLDIIPHFWHFCILYGELFFSATHSHWFTSVRQKKTWKTDVVWGLLAFLYISVFVWLLRPVTNLLLRLGKLFWFGLNQTLLHRDLKYFLIILLLNSIIVSSLVHCWCWLCLCVVLWELLWLFFKTHENQREVLLNYCTQICCFSLS